MSGLSLRQECHSRQLQHGQILVSVCFTLMPFAAGYALNYRLAVDFRKRLMLYSHYGKQHDL